MIDLAHWVNSHAAFVQALAAVVIVLLTTALVVITKQYAAAAERQVRAAENEVKVARAQFAAQFRPFLVPRQLPSGVPPTLFDAGITSNPDHYWIENAGAGTATNVQCRIERGLATATPRLILDFWQTLGVPVPAGRVAPLFATPHDVQLTTDMASGEQDLVRIQYQAMDGRCYETIAVWRLWRWQSVEQKEINQLDSREMPPEADAGL